MKLIKKGRKQTGWSKEFDCTGRGNGDGGCGSVLLVEQADVFTTASHARDETTTYNTFKCGQCGVLTDIKRDVRITFSPLSHSEWKKRNQQTSHQALNAQHLKKPTVEYSASAEPREGAFWECEACRSQSGSPTLCRSCLHNRELVAALWELSGNST